MPNQDWYDEAHEYWNTFPQHDYFNIEETREIYPVFLEFLQDIDGGHSPETSDHFWEFLHLMNMSYDSFDWEDFKEWYDEH